MNRRGAPCTQAIVSKSLEFHIPWLASLTVKRNVRVLIDGSIPVRQGMSGILAEFDNSQELYNDFRLYCENIARQILRAYGLRVHIVESRLKTRKSLSEKLQRPTKDYKLLTDVTDLAGIRIITYFDDDVDRVGQVIENEFEIDRARSVDKRKALGTNQFGYSSLHYVVSLISARCGLIECRRFKDLVCEIQVRSVLQHAWAEIEHDLGYKASSNVPDDISRRFSRLASTLEGADLDFRNIRDEIGAYMEDARSKILSSPGSLELNDITVQTLIEEDRFIRTLSLSIAQSAGVALVQSKESYPVIASALRSVGFMTVKGVQEAVADKAPTIQKLVMLSAENKGYRTLGQGFVLGNLYLVALAETRNPERIAESFREQGFFSEIDRRPEADRILRDFLIASAPPT